MQVKTRNKNGSEKMERKHLDPGINSESKQDPLAFGNSMIKLWRCLVMMPKK